MRLQSTLLMAAFGLLSALSAQAANIKISALPFTITSPGTYVLSSNLSFTTGNPGDSAISIASNIQGPVTINLNGFTISGGISSDRAITINSTNEGLISIKNGTITNFGYGLVVGGDNVDISNLTI
jgi:hypothetical protein